jgi:hypothetical protein
VAEERHGRGMGLHGTCELAFSPLASLPKCSFLSLTGNAVFWGMIRLNTSRYEYVMRAATLLETCELPPDFNIKLHDNQAHSDTTFHLYLTYKKYITNVMFIV